MDVVAHLIAFLLCAFAAWATIGAIRRDRDDPPTVRMKLAALIAGPPLLLLLAGVPFTTVTLYYLAGFAIIYGLIYGLAFVFTAASYGLGTTLRAVANLYGTGRRPEPARTQRTMPPPDPQKQRQQKSPDDTPVVFERQLK